MGFYVNHLVGDEDVHMAEDHSKLQESALAESIQDNAEHSDLEQVQMEDELRLRSRRRRLLKGLAGAPAIITLASGAALANLSSSSCVTASGVGGQASIGPRCRAVNPEVDYLPGTANPGLQPNDTYVYLRYNDPMWRGWYPGPTNQAPPTYTPTANKDWCLVYLSEHGNIPKTPYRGERTAATTRPVGMRKPKTNAAVGSRYFAVTKSCWTSFH